MLNILFILSIVATLVSIAALLIGCVALAFVVGLKNSTHNVVWKAAPVSSDPFAGEEKEDDEEITAEINKRFKKHANEELKPADAPFVDMDDATVTSNFP